MVERIVGKKAPHFEMDAVMVDKLFGKVSLKDSMEKGKWTVLLFYPMDFTPVCPTDITAISDRYDEFQELDAEVIGISTDTVYTHLAWVNTDRMQNGVGTLNFALAADTNHRVSKQYGVFVEEEGAALHGLFIISPIGVLHYQTLFYHNVGRDVDELLRVLQVLQIGGLYSEKWPPSQETL
ncbi:peroxiredoxin [Lysinibacillus sp. LZ02]|uniref:peroxiredoxin n=1 Tax=Lysinibacillus sp. LZ02 TaxID=3420668 RepID=UPI003D3604F0